MTSQDTTKRTSHIGFLNNQNTRHTKRQKGRRRRRLTMKVIEIKKIYRSGERIGHIFVPDDSSEDDILYRVEDWAEEDPSGQNYGYSVNYDEVTDKGKLIELTEKRIARLKDMLKRSTVRMKKEIRDMDAYLKELYIDEIKKIQTEL